ncbi:histidine protein methyltransferase 1 homolog [Scleropages formosus]|uniref:protein-histidine N-methyltransferase n=1 Tax=Scleropages formosus TaxID=113540 RepID=A0A8C9SZY8_SCLFO|nr:histidine protein methyltransferase 1 homolog [Scleropages formosus]
MAFCFNFDVGIETRDKPATTRKEQAQMKQGLTDFDGATDHGPTGVVKEAREHHPQDDPYLLENLVFETLNVGALPPIQYLNETVLEKTASEHTDDEDVLSQSAALRSDLISGVYEGGLKIWECTYDLLAFINDRGVVCAGKRVLDLGCGAGLLGIAALKIGASEVHFQDYNSTVIERLTLPNVLLNCDGDSEEEEEKDGSPSLKRRATDQSHLAMLTKCRFFSGDWTSFVQLMLGSGSGMHYDLILTSETIYNEAYYPSLHQVFHKLLAPNGLVYLATKSHYFGVGGGLLLFQDFVEQKAIFDLKCLKTVKEGLQRHVVVMSWKKSN